MKDWQWTALLALIGLAILGALEELIYQTKKGRVVIFKENADGSVIEGDFKLIDSPAAMPETAPTKPVRKSRSKPNVKGGDPL